MLKPLTEAFYSEVKRAAAFGRLCVETGDVWEVLSEHPAAAFGRLCVETVQYLMAFAKIAAAAFGRLCVETHSYAQSNNGATGSRPRAAVC